MSHHGPKPCSCPLKPSAAPLWTTITFEEALQDLSLSSYVIIALSFTFWTFIVSNPWKMLSLCLGVVYFGVETLFTTLTELDGEGHIRLKKYPPSLGHSTPEQFLANLLFIPSLYYIRSFMTAASVRIILTPLIIWGLEIVEGYFLTILFGYNRAWLYWGSYSRFGGNVHLQMFLPWLLFGVVVEFLNGCIIDPLLGHIPIFVW